MPRKGATELTPEQRAFIDIYDAGGQSLGAAWALAHGEKEFTHRMSCKAKTLSDGRLARQYRQEKARALGHPITAEPDRARGGRRPTIPKAIEMSIEIAETERIDLETWGSRNDVLVNLKRLALLSPEANVRRQATLDYARLSGQDWVDKDVTGKPQSLAVKKELEAKRRDPAYQDAVRRHFEWVFGGQREGELVPVGNQAGESAMRHDLEPGNGDDGESEESELDG